MEKISFDSTDGMQLVGCYYPAESEYGVVIAHGSSSNKDREKLVMLSEELSKLEVGVLRFDCRGSGESDDGMVTVQGYLDDLRAAMGHMRSKNHTSLGIMGDSLGGLTALLAYNTEANINAMVLWAPVTAAKTPGIFGTGTAKELAQKGYVEQEKDGRAFKYPAQYLRERERIKQEVLCSRVKCPILILHGDKDESVPLKQSRDAMQYFSSESELYVVEGGKHRLDKKLDVVIPKTVEWFRMHLVGA